MLFENSSTSFKTLCKTSEFTVRNEVHVTNLGTGRIGVGLASTSRKVDDSKSFSNSARAHAVKSFSPSLSIKAVMFFLSLPIPTHVSEDQLWLSLGSLKD